MHELKSVQTTSDVIVHEIHQDREGTAVCFDLLQFTNQTQPLQELRRGMGKRRRQGKKTSTHERRQEMNKWNGSFFFFIFFLFISPSFPFPFLPFLFSFFLSFIELLSSPLLLLHLFLLLCFSFPPQLTRLRFGFRIVRQRAMSLSGRSAGVYKSLQIQMIGRRSPGRARLSLLPFLFFFLGFDASLSFLPSSSSSPLSAPLSSSSSSSILPADVCLDFPRRAFGFFSVPLMSFTRACGGDGTNKPTTDQQNPKQKKR